METCKSKYLFFIASYPEPITDDRFFICRVRSLRELPSSGREQCKMRSFSCSSYSRVLKSSQQKLVKVHLDI